MEHTRFLLLTRSTSVSSFSSGSRKIAECTSLSLTLPTSYSLSLHRDYWVVSQGCWVLQFQDVSNTRIIAWLIDLHTFPKIRNNSQQRNLFFSLSKQRNLGLIFERAVPVDLYFRACRARWRCRVSVQSRQRARKYCITFRMGTCRQAMYSFHEHTPAHTWRRAFEPRQTQFPHAGRWTVFNALGFWKDFQNATSFQN